MHRPAPAILLTALAAFSSGCSSPEAGERVAGPQVKGLNERFEEKWAAFAAKPIASPSATPYDDDSDSRAAYLLGFRKGVNRGLRDGKNITIVCFLKPETRQEEAWIKGFETGRRIVDGRISEIYEEIGRELASEAESLR